MGDEEKEKENPGQAAESWNKNKRKLEPNEEGDGNDLEGGRSRLGDTYIISICYKYHLKICKQNVTQ